MHGRSRRRIDWDQPTADTQAEWHVTSVSCSDSSGSSQSPDRSPETAVKVAFLRRADAYPDAPSRVVVFETHMSWLFLGGPHAYKLKKPVRHEGLDFTTMEARRLDCEAELHLNRRLAPDVYLDVVPIVTDEAGRLALAARGHVVDWLVKMRRLSEETMLDRAIGDGRVDSSHIRKIAQLLADFYERAGRARMSGLHYRERLERGVRADLHELDDPVWRLPRALVRDVAQHQLERLERDAALFDARAHADRIVDGHGDLRPEHICLEAQPVIIDCLEFNQELRLLDPADELAFLALECERMGAPRVGERILDAYQELSGDWPDPRLLRFYRNYRAYRRAKIAVWHLRDQARTARDKWQQRAQRYLELAMSEP
jgi:aminoglycoside phosphotransferase family enzyme